VQAGRPAAGQTVKVAANQAWFEYIPARVKSPSGTLAEFGPPRQGIRDQAMGQE
jgi:alkaline phosphatase D